MSLPKLAGDKHPFPAGLGRDKHLSLPRLGTQHLSPPRLGNWRLQLPGGAVNLAGCGSLGRPAAPGTSGFWWRRQLGALRLVGAAGAIGHLRFPKAPSTWPGCGWLGRPAPRATSGSMWRRELSWLPLVGAASAIGQLRFSVARSTLPAAGWAAGAARHLRFLLAP